MLLKVSGAYDRAAEDVNDMTATQKTWARFKTHFITTYHKLKIQSKVQVKNMTKIEIPPLISNYLQKVATQFDGVHQQLANFDETNKTLKELVEECNKNITALGKIFKAFDIKSNKGNQRNLKTMIKKTKMLALELPSHQ